MAQKSGSVLNTKSDAVSRVYSKAELIRRIISRNSMFINWLRVIKDADCGHVGYSNADQAKDIMQTIKKENDIWLELLVSMTKED